MAPPLACRQNNRSACRPLRNDSSADGSSEAKTIDSGAENSTRYSPRASISAQQTDDEISKRKDLGKEFSPSFIFWGDINQSWAIFFGQRSDRFQAGWSICAAHHALTQKCTQNETVKKKTDMSLSSEENRYRSDLIFCRVVNSVCTVFMSFFLSNGISDANFGACLY